MSLKGTKHTAESIEKMRLAKLGKKCPEITREKISKANKGEHIVYF